MRYAICNETFQGWEWPRTCDAIAELGYQGVEVAPFTLAPDVRELDSAARRELAARATQAGLQVAGLHWLLVSPKGLSATSSDESVRNETASYLAALADFCADIGGRIMVFGSPSQRRIPDGGTAALAADRFCSTLEQAICRAERHGITICLEPLPPPEADFILRLSEAEALVGRIDHPCVRSIFDVKSASSEGRPLQELIGEYRHLIAHVHANDANRRGPGTGDTDFAPIFRALSAAGYAGWVSVEVFDYSPDPVTIGRESLAYMRGCEPALQEVAP
jgi:sugar phosphate isomerase/epimerase